MPFIITKERKGLVRPLIYNPNVTYFKDDFRNIDNWNITGSYQITENGIRLSGNSMAITKNNVLDGIDNFVVLMPISYHDTDEYTLIAFTDENGNEELSFKYIKEPDGARSHAVFVRGQIIWTTKSYVPPDFVLELHKIGTRLFIWEDSYVDIPSDLNLKKVMFGTSVGEVTFKNIGIYESAGYGIGVPRPIWTDKGILNINGYYYFIFERYWQPYYQDFILIQPSILITRDLVNFEQYKHLWISNVDIIHVNYAYYDGQYVYIWINDANGFRIIKVDSNFNIVDINSNVTINGLPDGSVLNSIYFVNIHGKWYAIGHITGDYVALFDTDGPQSVSLTFIKTLANFGGRDYPRSIVSHVVTDLIKEYVLVIGEDKYVLLDSDLENIVLSGSFDFVSVTESDVEIVLAGNKTLYVTSIPPKSW